MRIVSMVLLAIGLLLLILYTNKRRRARSGKPERPAEETSSGSPILKTIHACNAMRQRDDLLQKIRESRQKSCHDDFDIEPQQEPREQPMNEEDKEAIGLFMEHLFLSWEPEPPQAQELAAGVCINEDFMDRLNRGEIESIRGTEVYRKQKLNLEEAIASGRFNENVSKLINF